MKKIAIVGTNYLEGVKDQGMHMCLAHLLKPYHEDVDVYSNFYTSLLGSSHYIIMDNGACEGDLRPVDELISKARYFGVDEVILPDAFDDANTTRYFVTNQINQFRKELPNVKLMAVSHGDTMAEHAMNIAVYSKLGIDVIGIPKVVTTHLGPRARYRICLLIQEVDPNIEIHFLGAGEGVNEIHRIPEECKVRSVDSALPFILAKQGSYILAHRGNTKITFDETDINEMYLKDNLRDWWNI